MQSFVLIIKICMTYFMTDITSLKKVAKNLQIVLITLLKIIIKKKVYETGCHKILEVVIFLLLVILLNLNDYWI